MFIHRFVLLLLLTHRPPPPLPAGSDADSIGSASDLRARGDADHAGGDAEAAHGDCGTVCGTVTSSVYHAECESIAAEADAEGRVKAPGGAAGGRRRPRLATRGGKQSARRDQLIGHEYGARPLLDDDELSSGDDARNERRARDAGEDDSSDDGDIFAAAPFPRRSRHRRAQNDTPPPPPLPPLTSVAAAAPTSSATTVVVTTPAVPTPAVRSAPVVEPTPAPASASGPTAIVIPPELSDRAVRTAAAQAQSQPRPRPANPFLDSETAPPPLPPGATPGAPLVQLSTNHVPPLQLPTNQVPTPAAVTGQGSRGPEPVRPPANRVAPDFLMLLDAERTSSVGGGGAPKASTLPRLGQPSSAYSQFSNEQHSGDRGAPRSSGGGAGLAKLFTPSSRLQPAPCSESPHSDDESARLHRHRRGDRRPDKAASKYRSLANERSDDNTAAATATVLPSRGKNKKPKSKAPDRDGGGFANLSFENRCSDDDDDDTPVFARCGGTSSGSGDRLGSLRRTGNGLFSKLK